MAGAAAQSAEEGLPNTFAQFAGFPQNTEATPLGATMSDAPSGMSLEHNGAPHTKTEGGDSAV